MRKIIYEDCNNNATFLKGLFSQIQELSDMQLSWSISNLEFAPIDKGDFINGVPSIEMEELFSFQKRILDEHIIIVAHNFLMQLLENIRTVYYGNFEVVVKDKPLKITVFDGDIIEVDGEIEDEIKF